MEDYRQYMAMIALKGRRAPFEDLIPPSAKMNLEMAREVEWIQKALETSEVACNIDQCPAHQLHAGRMMPCILASISHMWLGSTLFKHKVIVYMPYTSRKF